ncbi:helicase ARIP4-like isoform X2 [Mytilus galloprovincialis]|uniref:helicase ARIP4-like isoform X2 n=1 Tax=Mytilus galloprovincialis TaxID=29158 RepID=UPI003F7C7A48
MSLEAYLSGSISSDVQNGQNMESFQPNPIYQDNNPIYQDNNPIYQDNSLSQFLEGDSNNFVNQMNSSQFTGNNSMNFTGSSFQNIPNNAAINMVLDGDNDDDLDFDDDEDGNEEVDSNDEAIDDEDEDEVDDDNEEEGSEDESDEKSDENIMENIIEKVIEPEKTEKEKIMDNVNRVIDEVAKNVTSSVDFGGAPLQQEGGETKPKKTRKRKKNSDDKKKEKKKRKVKPTNMRKNIRELIDNTALESTTIEAQTEELERKKRLQELKKQLMEKEKEKDSQLKSLLEDNEEEKSNDVILLDSSDEGKNKKKDGDVIDISSDEDDIMITNDMEDDSLESEDPNNSGSHIDDSMNHPDEQGRVLVNIGHPPEEQDIFLVPQIAKYIKRHQIGGVRFLYDNLIESVSRFKSSPGFGCILAHSMGLGKTIQMIALIDVLLRHTSAKSVLLIVPINTLQNWMSEINMWCPESVPEGYPDVQLRNFKTYILNDNFKTPYSRAKVIVEWHKTGGVLLMGYEMYRLMTSRKGHIAQPKKPGRKAAGRETIIDVDEEDKTKDLFVDVHEALQNPGPDMVVCDEGHRIKNSHAGISQSLKTIRTRRRVVLTGYPLQNNLIEYWCMVDFVRPNYLGNKTEFCNMFERPIMNGQCADSTESDTKLMRYRAHVLHSLLEGFVQRRGHTVLQAALPPKKEFIILITMSQIQKMLYKEFMDNLAETSLNTWATTNPIKAFSVCCKIWNHPDILYKIVRQKKIDLEDNDLDIETDSAGVKKKKKQGATGSPAGISPFMDKKNDQAITYEWAEKLLKNYTPGLLEMGGKMMLLFELINETLAVGDKLLIFSQSLYTLSLLEELLCKMKVPRPEMDEYWSKNKSYFRLDGSTLAQEREKLIGQFNAPDNNRVWLFLLSTRAGSLGINLIGANRVVVMDASWNPCHDCQAVCRVYRFGQVKPSYIYRFVTDNTMEKKIYDRQVNKQGMSDRVVDELQPQNNFSKRHVDNLLHYEDVETDPLDFSDCNYGDEALNNVLRRQGHWLTKKPFTHESLLIDKKELRLSKKEKRLAKQSYVMEKKLNLTYSRPSYAAFYPKAGGVPRPTHHPPWNQPTPFNRPVASVKPMMTTPVPMKPKDGVSIIPQTKPGVTVHKIVTTTDITLPGTTTNTQSGVSASGGTLVNKIPAGQQVFVIKTPKGVYIRTKEGKIFAVRAKTPLLSGISTESTSSVTTVTIKNSTATVAPKVGTAQPIIVYPKTGSAVINRKPTSRQPRAIKPNQSKNKAEGKIKMNLNSEIKSELNKSGPSSMMDLNIMKNSGTDIEPAVNIPTEMDMDPRSSSVSAIGSLLSLDNEKDTSTKSGSEPNIAGLDPKDGIEMLARSNSQMGIVSLPGSNNLVVKSLPQSNSQPGLESQTESTTENILNSVVGIERQNSSSSQMSSADEGQVHFDNNDSQFGSDMGTFDQSDNSNSNSQIFEFDNRPSDRQQGFLESLFDMSEITPYQPSRQDTNQSMSRVDSSASISSNMGHIDLREDTDKYQEEGSDNSFMSRYPRIAPNTRNNYPQHNNPMPHMFNPMPGFNQGSPQMGYNPMYTPYPVLFPQNSHQSQPTSTNNGAVTNTTQSDYMSPIQSMSQMGSSGMMGFPFSPYSFPMPAPYMMGGMPNPYMAMGMPSPYGHQGGMMPPPNSANVGQQQQQTQDKTT